jgi:hypothetical protein
MICTGAGKSAVSAALGLLQQALKERDNAKKDFPFSYTDSGVMPFSGVYGFSGIFNHDPGFPLPYNRNQSAFYRANHDPVH